MADFELSDHWNEGKPPEVNQEWRVCVTPNPVHTGALTMGDMLTV